MKGQRCEPFFAYQWTILCFLRTTKSDQSCARETKSAGSENGRCAARRLLMSDWRSPFSAYSSTMQMCCGSCWCVGVFVLLVKRSPSTKQSWRDRIPQSTTHRTSRRLDGEVSTGWTPANQQKQVKMRCDFFSILWSVCVVAVAVKRICFACFLLLVEFVTIM